MSSSLRTSLLLRTGVATAIVFVVAGTILYMLVGSDLQTQFDHALISKARLLASTVEQTPLGVEIEFAELEMGEFLSPTGPGFLQLWRNDGAVLYRSASLNGSDLPQVAASLDEPVFQSMDLPGDLSCRAVCLTFTPRLEEDWIEQIYNPGVQEMRDSHITLVLARTTQFTDRVLARFRLLLVVLLFATLIVVSGSLAWAVKSGLKPTERLAAEINRIGEQDLSMRLADEVVPEEIRPVVVRLNDLLDRLERAFARERAFSADVAHELRTPLAGLQSVLEVSLARLRSTEEYEATLEECLHISGHLRTLIGNLLSLARIESGTLKLDSRTVTLNTLLRSNWEHFAERAEARNLSLEWELTPESNLTTDPTLLDAAIRNVLDNAVGYADKGGTLTITTTRAAGVASVRVTNTGCELTQEKAEELRDRFRRGDAARSATGTHCGLGLALVQETLRALGGDVRIQAEPGGRYEITLTLPAEDAV
jgi:two-component system sensor histidine kinase QseC